MKANKKILLVQYEIIFHVMHEEKKHFSYFDLDWLIVKQVVATYWQRRKQESLYRKKMWNWIQIYIEKHFASRFWKCYGEIGFRQIEHGWDNEKK